MCQACWALASRRAGAASILSPEAAPAAPGARFTAVAEWVSEPADDDGRTDVADESAPRVDAGSS